MCARLHGNDVGAEQLHAVHVETLAFHVFSTHVDIALQTQPGGNAGAGNAMLSRARFRDDARFPHAFREQGLADGIADLVRAGVIEIFALEIHLRPAQLTGEPLGEIQGGGSTHVMGEIVVELTLKLGIVAYVGVEFRQIIQRVRQRLRHEAPAERTEVSVVAGLCIVAAPFVRDCCLICHAWPPQ